MRNDLILFAKQAAKAGKSSGNKGRSNSGVGANLSAKRLQTLKSLYGEVRVQDVLMQCMYQVTIEDIFGIGKDIPWFKDKTLGYLVTEADLSFGGAESESYHAGSYQANYLTQQTADDMDMTFIETLNGDIFNSYQACKNLAFNNDGTVNEPRKYTFKLSIALLNHKHHVSKPPVIKSWLVSVKEGRCEVSSAGRSEVIKATITFQKMMPLMFGK